MNEEVLKHITNVLLDESIEKITFGTFYSHYEKCGCPISALAESLDSNWKACVAYGEFSYDNDDVRGAQVVAWNKLRTFDLNDINEAVWKIDEFCQDRNWVATRALTMEQRKEMARDLH